MHSEAFTRTETDTQTLTDTMATAPNITTYLLTTKLNFRRHFMTVGH